MGGDNHHSLPEPLIPDGSPEETDTAESAIFGRIGGDVGRTATLDDLFSPTSILRGTAGPLFAGINYNRIAKEVQEIL